MDGREWMGGEEGRGGDLAILPPQPQIPGYATDRGRSWPRGGSRDQSLRV